MIILGTFISLLICHLLILILILITYWFERVQMRTPFELPRWGKILQNIGGSFLAYISLIIIYNACYILMGNIWGTSGVLINISGFIIAIFGGIFLLFTTQLLKPNIQSISALIIIIVSQLLINIVFIETFRESEIYLILPFGIGLFGYIIWEIIYGGQNIILWDYSQKLQKKGLYQIGIFLILIFSIELILEFEGISLYALIL